jgi:hypothetical protein
VSVPAPFKFRDGDYAMNFPHERDGDRTTARDAMKRNGCRAIRFERLPTGTLVAHGYIARVDGPEVEQL